jgi:hypothetical protein
MVPRGAVLSSFIRPAFTKHFRQSPSGASSASAPPHRLQSCTQEVYLSISSIPPLTEENRQKGYRKIRPEFKGRVTGILPPKAVSIQ